MEKVYLAVVRGAPKQSEWTCRLKLAPDPSARGRMKVDARHGKEAETQFRVVQSKADTALVEARPFTGRTHQIRVHLAESGHPVVGDPLYGAERQGKDEPLTPALSPSEGERGNTRRLSGGARFSGNRRQGSGEARFRESELGLRAVGLAYMDPFTRRRVEIQAPVEGFVREYGFAIPTLYRGKP
jgi:23S rRNA-/tRNA-specific pseudouridylate synthase